MMPKEPMRGATLFSHANKMTQAYHVMLTPLCKETGLPPLALDILLFLANNPEHNTAKDICRVRGHKPGIVSVHVERLVNDGLLERREMPGDRAADAAYLYGKSAGYHHARTGDPVEVWASSDGGDFKGRP